MEKKIIFRQIIITQSCELSDTNVLQYKFYNQGLNRVMINDTIVLEPVAYPNQFATQFLFLTNENENDCTIYRIRFDQENNNRNKLLVIMKMRV